jgi:hypothetical protein
MRSIALAVVLARAETSESQLDGHMPLTGG